MNELQKHRRSNTVGLLKLWASKEAQFHYKKSVPFVNVPAEMFCQWDDFFAPDQEWFREAFSEAEWQALNRFNSIFEGVCNSTPQMLPDIDQFVHTHEWQLLHQTAKEIIKEFKEE